MARAWHMCLLALICSAALRPVWSEETVATVEDDEYADSERAHLVVRKYIKQELVVIGRNVTVTLDIYNAGTSAASNVKIQDSLADNTKLLEGELEVSFPKIAAGSHMKHSYVIVCTPGETVRQLPVAVVKYQAEAEGSEIQAGITSTQAFYAITPVQEIQRYALIAGRYASLGICKTPGDWQTAGIIIGVLSAVLGVNYAVKSVSTARVTRKRNRALQALEKEQ